MAGQLKTLEINAFICLFYLTEEFRFSDQCKCTLIKIQNYSSHLSQLWSPQQPKAYSDAFDTNSKFTFVI